MRNGPAVAARAETRRALGSAWTQLVELVERLEGDLREANRRGDAWRNEVAGAVRERDAALERLRAVEAEFHVAMAEARAEFVDAVRPRLGNKADSDQRIERIRRRVEEHGYLVGDRSDVLWLCELAARAQADKRLVGDPDVDPKDSATCECGDPGCDGKGQYREKERG